MLWQWALIACSLCRATSAFYIPGNSPTTYEVGARIPIHVNKMTSPKTQVPYGYYTLDICPPDHIETEAENLGQILNGDVIQNTAYQVRMQVDEKCRFLCQKTLKDSSIAQLTSMIDDDYSVNLLADDLPAALRVRQMSYALKEAETSLDLLVVGGYPLGMKLPHNGGYVLINHLDMIIKYHDLGGDKGSRVVGFELESRSVQHPPITPSAALVCDERLPMQNLTAKQPGEQIYFSYSVRFVPSSVDWATRWDAYLNAASGPDSIHWFAIVNSFFVVVVLSIVILTILLRTVLRDIANYNDLPDIESIQEESGWKMIHGDVFRRPRFSKLLACCTGTGVQVVIMIGLTLLFSMMGLLSPANRGALLQAMLILFAFMGGPAGYVSARFNKLFQGEETHRAFTVTLLTAFLYTGVCFTTFLMLNVMLWYEGSSGAVPFRYLFLLVVLWVGVSVPLVFVGSYMGYRKPGMVMPVRTNQIPRQIPKQPWYLRSKMMYASGGILPFGALLSEMSFIISSVWQHRFYYLFGFLTLVVIILLLTCAQTSVVFTYFYLTGEDYRWWWKSYWVSAFSAIYFFGFCVFYFFDALQITRLPSILLYFSYSALMAYTLFLSTGAVGFIASFFFVKAIYSAVKVD